MLVKLQIKFVAKTAEFNSRQLYTIKNDIIMLFSSWGDYALKRKARYRMATSSITANFTISDPKAYLPSEASFAQQSGYSSARAFATAFIRNSRKANTPAVMPWRMITSADMVKKGV